MHISDRSLLKNLSSPKNHNYCSSLLPPHPLPVKNPPAQRRKNSAYKPSFSDIAYISDLIPKIA